MLNKMIEELVEYDISVYKKMSSEDKIEFVSDLVTEKYELLSEKEIVEFYTSLKG